MSQKILFILARNRGRSIYSIFGSPEVTAIALITDLPTLRVLKSVEPIASYRRVNRSPTSIIKPKPIGILLLTLRINSFLLNAEFDAWIGK
jgi:hypothetical protein